MTGAIPIHVPLCIPGPVANTFGDFWRTVWDQGVCVIVMVTNIVEGGRVGRNVNVRMLENFIVFLGF